MCDESFMPVGIMFGTHEELDKHLKLLRLFLIFMRKGELTDFAAEQYVALIGDKSLKVKASKVSSMKTNGKFEVE